MRYSFHLALFFLGASVSVSAQDALVAAPAVQADAKGAERIAIQKALLLATLLQKAEQAEESTLSTEEQNMLRCASYAKAEGAPNRFVELLQASAKATTMEEGDALTQEFDKILEEYAIDITRLYVWASLCTEKPDAIAALFAGQAGSELLRSELLSADKSYVQQLSPEQFQATSDAIKKSMLMLYFLTIADNNRISDEHMAQVLTQAETWGAPKMFTRLLAADASRTIAPNMRYEVNVFLSDLFETYIIDRTALRLYAELSPLNATEMLALLKNQGVVKTFTVTPAFNLLPKISESLTLEQLDELSEQWLMDTRHLAETLAFITPENADEVDLADIASRIPSYFRLQSIQKKHDTELAARVNELKKNRLKDLIIALKVSQDQLERLLTIKDQLPIPLQALLTQFI